MNKLKFDSAGDILTHYKVKAFVGRVDTVYIIADKDTFLYFSFDGFYTLIMMSSKNLSEMEQ